MLNIRINHIDNDSEENNYISIDIESSTLAGVYGSKKKQLILLLAGLENYEGDIVLDSISMKGDFDEYLDQIAVATKESIINSSLTVNEFLDFYGCMTNALTDDYEIRKKHLLHEFGLEYYRNTQMNYLKKKDRAKVKFLSLFLKERTLILLDTFLESFRKNELNKIVKFLQNYAKDEKIILIGSDDYQLLQSVSETIYILN